MIIYKNIYKFCFFTSIIIVFLSENAFGGSAYPAINNRIDFVENIGQYEDNDIKFSARAGASGIYFMQNGISYIFRGAEKESIEPNKESLSEIKAYRLNMEFIGANAHCSIYGLNEQKGIYNYYIKGNSVGITGARGFSEILYEDIYPNIDLKIYKSPEKKGFKYDFIVKPGADPDNIRFKYIGLNNIKISDMGSLLITTPYGIVEENKPFTYQDINHKEEVIPSRFKINPENEISFELGAYDRTKELKIDPNVIWATFLGGTNFDHGYSISIDKNNNFIIAGTTSSEDFPVSLNAAQEINGGHYDAFISYYDYDGNMMWSTFYGGSENEYCSAVCVDDKLNSYLTGWTWSTDFPVTSGAFQEKFGGQTADDIDGFIVKFNPGGKLLWSTYCGALGEEHLYGIDVNNSGDVAVCGWSSSHTFTMPEETIQKTNGGYEDCLIVQFNADGEYKWSTFLGRDSTDNAQNIQYNSFGEMVISGHTRSSDFPVTGHAYQKYLKNSMDAFITIIDLGGNIKYSTFYGGTKNDYSYGMDLDDDDNIYITGSTFSADFPVTENCFSESLSGSRDAYLAKFTARGDLKWASYYGGIERDHSEGIAVDTKSNVIIVGRTFSHDLQITPGAQQEFLNGETDAYVAKFYGENGDIYWSTYYGGALSEWGWGISTDQFDNVYISGDTESEDFPSIDAALQSDFGGKADAFIVKLCASCPNPMINVMGDSAFCKGESVTLDAGEEFVKYKWSNGATTRRIEVFKGGEYYVTVHDENLCSAKSKPVTITEYPLPVPKIYGDRNICEGDSALLKVSDIYESVLWSTGSTENAIKVSEAGFYEATVVDSNGCMGSASIDVTVHPKPETKILGATSVCASSLRIAYHEKYYPGHIYIWEVEGGEIAEGSETNYIYVNWFKDGGVGKVILTHAVEETGCFSIDTMLVTISDELIPDIEADTEDYSFCEGDTLELKAGDGYTSYYWSNGDTTKSILVTLPGNYSIHVQDASGCEGENDVTVIMHTKPAPAVIGESNICVPAENLVFETEFNEGHAYKWSAGSAEVVSGLDSSRLVVNMDSTGTDTLYVTETIETSGCSASSEIFVINKYPKPDMHILYETLDFCEGDSITLSADKDYDSYSWSNNKTGKEITVKAAGIYSLEICDSHGCVSIDSVAVFSHPRPQEPEISRSKDTLISTQALSYQWYFNNEIIPGETNMKVFPIKTGIYQVEVFNDFGCSSLSDPFEVLYYNAAATISIKSESLLDTIFSETGKEINAVLFIDNSHYFNLAEVYNYEAFISYNNTVLLPIDDFEYTANQPGSSQIKVSGERTDTIGILRNIKFFTALGNSECSVISLDSVNWIEREVNVDTKGAIFCLTSLCSAGGDTRLFRDAGEITELANKPNPFSDETIIEFGLPSDSYASLIFSDMLGRNIKTLFSGELKSGAHTIRMDSDNMQSGVYFIILQTPFKKYYRRVEIVK